MNESSTEFLITNIFRRRATDHIASILQVLSAQNKLFYRKHFKSTGLTLINTIKAHPYNKYTCKTEIKELVEKIFGIALDWDSYKF